MNIQWIPVASIRPAEKNLNVMSPTDYAALVRAIQTVGFVQPVLVRDAGNSVFNMLDGHHRRQAAIDIGLDDIPAAVLGETEETPPDEVLSVMMNRIRGQLDLAGVSLLVGDLFENGAELDELTLMGFTESEVRELIDTANSSTPDLDEMGSPPEPEPEEVIRPFVLELTFRTRDELKLAKKALRKAAGKGVDLSIGLLRVIGEDA